jgi:hypothetical protein
MPRLARRCQCCDALPWLTFITARIRDEGRDEGGFSRLSESTEEDDAKESDAEHSTCRNPLPPTMMERAQMGRPEHDAPAFPLQSAMGDQNS